MMTLTEKWKMEELRESIIEAVELKFGTSTEDLKEKLNRINDYQTLKQLFRKVLTANSLNEIKME